LVLRKDKAYKKKLSGMVPRESSTSKVDFNDNIDDFLTLANIFWSHVVALHKWYIYLGIWWPCVDTKVLKGG